MPRPPVLVREDDVGDRTPIYGERRHERGAHLPPRATRRDERPDRWHRWAMPGHTVTGTSRDSAIYPCVYTDRSFPLNVRRPPRSQRQIYVSVR
jgi:hypothetical protein